MNYDATSNNLCMNSIRHSREMGTNVLAESQQASLKEGVSILTASRTSQYALETSGAGVFTSLIHDALGNVTAASIYGFADQTLGAWIKDHFLYMFPRCYPYENANQRLL